MDNLEQLTPQGTEDEEKLTPQGTEDEEKLTPQGKEDEEKQNKNTMQYVSDTTIRKHTQIT